MRLVCALVLALLALPANAASVTLVLQFEDAYSPESVDAMKRELASIVADSGLHVDWRMLADVQPAETFESLVVVRFRGACLLRPDTSLMDERGYYAFTHVSQDGVQPFSEVECDKVASSIRPELSKSQWRQPDSVLGRALGRVLAHELYHMLAKSQHHAGEGVTRSSLTPGQLLSHRLKMNRADLKQLR
jgi:hypothetical protein